MFNRNKLETPYTDIDVNRIAINELANKRRNDITGDRYGNTLSDDMFSIKNAGRVPDKHTPQSYDYFNDPEPIATAQPMEPAAGWNELIPQLSKPREETPVAQYLEANPYLKGENNLFGRKKVLGDPNSAKDWGTWNDGWTLEDDILEFPDLYTDEQLAWAENKRAEREAANRVNSLGVDDLRAEKLGTYQDPKDWVSRRDADIDYSTGTFVNYGALSPATIEQMAKMGVNKPVDRDINAVTRDDAAEYLNFLLNAYRRRNEQTNY